MSTFNKETKNPTTGEWEEAVWIDDYFGNHIYGVQFPSGAIYNADEVELETRGN